jgi:DNA-binding transcriptional MerR regulator
MKACDVQDCSRPARVRGLCEAHYTRLRRHGDPLGGKAPRPGRSVNDLLRMTGLTYRQLDYWVRQGYLQPDNPEPGSGVNRKWSTLEIAVATTMGALVNAGLAVEKAAVIARETLTYPMGRATLAPGIEVVLSDLPTVTDARRTELDDALRGLDHREWAGGKRTA